MLIIYKNTKKILKLKIEIAVIDLNNDQYTLFVKNIN